jgi:hypothetical protein
MLFLGGSMAYVGKRNDKILNFVVVEFFSFELI